ncbi:MAG: TolC family protein [Leptospiraceae bacterium]|nr:TolC family protein [Leptospiraceae bacterium]MCP5493546.1 TolC family protein [Leptospiraceae bacterium]
MLIKNVLLRERMGSIHLNFRFFVFFYVFISIFFNDFPLYSQKSPQKLEKSSDKKTNNKKILKLTLEEAIRQVIDNNLTIQNAKYEIVKSDSEYLKNESKYAWKALGEVQYFQTVLPNNRVNYFSGNKQQNNKYSVGVEKQFETQTYIKIEGSTVRYDSNAFESDFIPQQFKILAIRPLYTGALSFTISQELLKYSFGKTDKNTKKILKAKSIIKVDEMIYTLTNLVAQSLVQYWTIGILDSSVQTYQKLLQNTKNIRNITARKKNIGLAERFEVNQWNSVVHEIEIKLENAKRERDEAKRNLVRILNVDPASEISGVTDLTTALPNDINLERDINYAYEHRIDLKNLKREMEISKLSVENALNDQLPSLKLSATYSTRGQTVNSSMYNFYFNNQGVSSLRYPESRADLNFSYPLWDEGVKSKIRDERSQEKQLQIRENNLKKEIRDDIVSAYDGILASHKILKTSQTTEAETDRFYNGILKGYGQGRFSAIAVKNALDSNIQAKLGAIQSKINYNINLLRYDLAKNYLFEKYGIDVYKIIDSLKTKK